MGDDSEGSREDRSNSAGPGSDVTGSGAVSVTLRKQELGGDRGDAQGSDSVPPLGGATDHGDDGKPWGWRRVGASSGRGGNGLCRAPTHWSIHKEVADNHNGEGVLPACICIVHRGGDNDGDKLDCALLGSRRGK